MNIFVAKFDIGIMGIAILSKGFVTKRHNLFEVYKVSTRIYIVFLQLASGKSSLANNIIVSYSGDGFERN